MSYYTTNDVKSPLWYLPGVAGVSPSFGIVDHTALVQAALDSTEDDCLFEEGIYNITRPLTFSQNSKTIRGTGPGTTFRLANGANCLMFNSTTALSNITIRDLDLDGNGANQTDGAARGDRKILVIKNITGFQMLNCTVHDARHGALGEVGSSSYVLIAGNRFYNIGTSVTFPCDCIYVNNGHHIRIYGNSVDGTTGANTDTGFAQDGIDHSAIVGNIIEGMTDGVSVSTSSGATSFHNVIDGNVIKGIGNTANSYGVQCRQLGGAGAGGNLHDIIISNNVFENCNSAVWVELTDRLKISGNISTNLVGTEMYHIKLNTAAGTINDITIRNNCFQAGTRGIFFSANGTYGGNIVIEENEFIGTTTPIFSLTSSAAVNYVRRNPGWNPIGNYSGTGGKPSTPGIPASTTPLVNNTGYDATVFITGGTVSAIAIGGTATGITLATSVIAQFRVPANQSITLTYSVAPTWLWFGD